MSSYPEPEQETAGDAASDEEDEVGWNVDCELH